MTDTILTRTQRVCERLTVSLHGDVWFAHDEYAPFALDRDAWCGMGEPETITVTIEPGDTLNSGRQAALTMGAGETS